MATISKETNTNPSKIPLFIWFFEVIFVLVFCCVIINMSVIPWPPTYTITNLSNHEEIKLSNTTMIFSLLVTNSNYGKDIIYDYETKISLYKNGNSLIGVTTLPARPGSVLSGKSNSSSLVLLNVYQEKMKYGSSDGNGDLKIGLETKVRYIVLGWTTRSHLLNFEAFLPIDENGKLSLGDEGIKLEPMKHKQ